jgi:hypothetical protein
LVSVGSLLDDGRYIFLVESGEQAKLIFGNRNETSTVCEEVLKHSEFQAVVRDAIKRFGL